MKPRLAVELMTSRMLWTTAFRYLEEAAWLRVDGVREQESILEQLNLVLQELKFRGDQLALLPEAEGRRKPGPADVEAS